MGLFLEFPLNISNQRISAKRRDNKLGILEKGGFPVRFFHIQICSTRVRFCKPGEAAQQISQTPLSGQ